MSGQSSQYERDPHFMPPTPESVSAIQDALDGLIDQPDATIERDLIYTTGSYVFDLRRLTPAVVDDENVGVMSEDEDYAFGLAKYGIDENDESKALFREQAANSAYGVHLSINTDHSGKLLIELGADGVVKCDIYRKEQSTMDAHRRRELGLDVLSQSQVEQLTKILKVIKHSITVGLTEEQELLFGMKVDQFVSSVLGDGAVEDSGDTQPDSTLTAQQLKQNYLALLACGSTVLTERVGDLPLPSGAYVVDLERTSAVNQGLARMTLSGRIAYDLTVREPGQGLVRVEDFFDTSLPVKDLMPEVVSNILKLDFASDRHTFQKIIRHDTSMVSRLGDDLMYLLVGREQATFDEELKPRAWELSELADQLAETNMQARPGHKKELREGFHKLTQADADELLVLLGAQND